MPTYLRIIIASVVAVLLGAVDFFCAMLFWWRSNGNNAVWLSVLAAGVFLVPAAFVALFAWLPRQDGPA